MNEIVTNRLLIPSNAKTVLQLLKPKQPELGAANLFSLASIKPIPEALAESPSFLLPLSLMNLDFPEFEEKLREKAIRSIYRGWDGKKDPDQIRERLVDLRQQLNGSEKDLKTLKDATRNFDEFGYISAYDWRMEHWGTTQDILTLNEASFTLPTRQIEFQTAWLPPLRALRYLADTFPSVRFELDYRFHPDTSWTHIEILPITPFGY